ncbi:hypothetical protein [Pseudoxanthomonas sp. UTMC 1351]|uniref:hypothetical protein n=1 Tax=Pseudoxanthomonas sp. UTMC 1351 TaxID=2695853 RepID=UPI0034CFDA38
MHDGNNRHDHSRATEPASIEEAGVNLLWTSGWDSTFQLLQLLLKHRLPVTPYYLEDSSRASTSTELQAMQRIRDALYDAFPETRALLRPLRRFRVADLDSDPDISEALRTIRSRVYLGSQYEWLALFCKHHGMADIELSVHIDDKVQAVLAPFVRAYDQGGKYRSFRMDPCHADKAEYTLFRYFSFPLFQIDKRAMARDAERADWSWIMDMTWFCHRPVRGMPCGACAPCVYTIDEGLAWRVPRSRRALSYLYRKLALPLKPPLRAALASVRRR